MRNVYLTGWAAGTPVERVRAALTFEAIAFDDRTGVETSRDDDRVPALSLRFDGRDMRISQSLAILNFLEEVHPSPALSPKDIADRARARTLLNMMVCDLQPLLDAVPMQRNSVWDHVLRETDRLCDSHGYAVGDALSIADICVVPELQRACAAGWDLQSCFNLTRILNVAGKHPAFEH